MGCLQGRGGGGPGPVTHRVRIFGMWLKLVTRMRLMLLLLSVLQRPGKTETVSREQPEGHQEPMRSTTGRDGCDCKRDHTSAATGQWAEQLGTSGRACLENPIPVASGSLPPLGCSLSTLYPPEAVIWLPEILLCAECFMTVSLILTPTMPVTYYCSHFRE